MNKTLKQILFLGFFLFSILNLSAQQTVDCNGQPFSLEITGDTSFCEGQNTILSAADTYSTYEWSNGETTPSITIDTPGEYSLTVTNDDDCVVADTVMVEVLALPTVQINGDTSICTGDFTTLIPTSGFASYQWSNSFSGQILIADEPGVYTVTVTDQNTCQNTDSIEVIAGAVPDLQIVGDTILCKGESTILSLNDTFDEQEWSNGSVLTTIPVTTSGTYSVTVLNDGACETTTSVEVIVSEPEVNISGDTSFCGSSFTTLIASSDFSSYEWSTGFPGQILVVNAAGTYAITVTDEYGCTDTDSVQVENLPQPMLSVSGPATFCEGDTVQLSLSTDVDNFEWSNNAITDTIDIFSGGDYTATAFAENGCSVSETISVAELASPMAEITGDTQLCIGEVTNLSVNTMQGNYLWSDGSEAAAISVDTEGWYAVSITNNNLCTAVDSVFVEVNDPDVQITGLPGFCPGGFTVLTASPGFDNYEWSTGIPSQVLAVSEPGVYTISVTDNNGCTDSDSLMVGLLPQPVVTISGDTSICEGEPTALNAGDQFESYQWSVPNEENAVLNVNTSGAYSVTVTDSNGCIADTSVVVTAFDLPNPAIDGIPLICSGDPTTLQAEPGFESYEWTGGTTGTELTVNVDGLYTLTVIDTNGCTGSNSIFVETVIRDGIATIEGEDRFCAGASTNLNTQVGFASYEWSTGSQGVNIEVDMPGTVTLFALDANGCPNYDTLTITELPNPDIEIGGQASYCADQSTSLFIPVGYDSYVWSTGAEVNSITVAEEGVYTVTVTDDNGCQSSDIVFVNEIPTPEPVITGDLSLCPGQTSSLMVNEGFEAYNWSTGSEENAIDVSSSGVYSVTVTEDTGCTGSYLIFVSQVPDVDLNVESDSILCVGEELSITASGNYNFINWSTGSNQDQIQVDTAGMYIVEAGNFFGCTRTDTIHIIEQEPPLVAIQGDSVLCIDQIGQLFTDLDPGNYDFEWSLSGSNNDSISITDAGEYALTVTDDFGCQSSDTLQVIQAEPALEALNGITEICPGTSTLITALGDFESIEWSGGEMVSAVELSGAGTYSVTVTDQYGCITTDSLEIIEYEAATVDILSDGVICDGVPETIYADGNFETLEWSTGAETDSIILDIAMPLSVEVLTSDGCIATDSLDILLQNNPQVMINGDTLFCESTSISLTTETDVETLDYAWSDGSIADGLTINQADIYSVTVTDEFGCQGVDSFEVNFYPPALLGVVGDVEFCPGDTTTLLALGAYTNIEWSTGEMTDSILITEPGNYSVDVSDDFGCTGAETLVLEWLPAPDLEVQGDTAFCEATSTELLALVSGGDFLSWSNGETDPQITITAGGTYTATGIGSNGCTTSVEIQALEQALPEPMLTGDLAFCQNDSTLLSTTDPFEAYQWSDLSEDSSLTVTSPGNYSLTVTDMNNCQGSIDFEVTDLALPTLTLSDTMFCSNDSLQLMPQETFDAYVWSDGSENSSLTVTAPGMYALTVTDEQGCSNEASVEVGTLPSPEPEIIGAPEICPEGQATLSLNEIYAAYSWSTNSQDDSIDIENAAEYSVTVTANNGCTGIASLLVSELPSPDVQIVGNTDFCEGTSTLLSTNNTFDSYLWNDTLDAPNIVVTTAGMVNLEVVDTNGCIGTQSIEVNQLALPMAETGESQTINCIDNTVIIGTDTPMDNLIYAWSGPGITTNNQELAQPTVDLAGTYTLIVTDTVTSCVSLPQMLEVAIDTIAPSFLIESDDLLTCAVPSITAGFNFTQPINNYELEWTDANDQLLNTADEIELDESGWYYLNIFNIENGCVSQDSLEILEDFEAPVANAGSEMVITCDQVSVSLDGSASSQGDSILYNWSSVGGQIITGVDDPNPVVGQSGLYILEVLNQGNGCIARDTVAVTANTEMPLAEAGADQFLDCFDDMAILDGSDSQQAGNLRFVWRFENIFLVDDQLMPTVRDSGMYYLEVIDLDNGCSSIDSVQVSPDPEAIEAVLLEVDTIRCFGEEDGRIQISKVIGGRSPLLFSFQGGEFSNDQIYSGLGAGNYTIRVEDSRGCQFLVEQELLDGNMFDLDLGEDAYLEFGESHTINPQIINTGGPIVSANWSSDRGDTCETCENWEVSPAATTQYMLELMNEDGCMATDEVIVFIDNRKRLHIPNVFSPNEDGTNDYFTLFGGSNAVTIKSLQIYDRWGNQVFVKNNIPLNEESEGWDGTFNGQKMPTAVYVFRAEVVFTDGEVEQYKGDILLMR